MKKTVLFFGSFNPIHKAHLSIAEYILEKNLGDELWFVVSPQNPFKPPEGIAPENDRIEMVRIAINHSKYRDRMCASDIEFDMPKPSYTIDTLRKLWKIYPDREFSILMGSDNLALFRKWKDFDDIIENCRVFVYTRGGYPLNENILSLGDIVTLDNAPVYDISSTKFRSMLRFGEDAKEFLPDGVFNYIKEKNIYATSNNDR
ncbi:MAG: nicotinate (nicotinamide) nucleotide adenylyltransferase [Rikenellaceae bacterium]|nr:nicotinate (nicotinamide) nucleotide adenylyltransferase [Rikenellaceae bacterium]